MDELVRCGLELVEDGSIVFVLLNWINIYCYWMNNIQDWCISCQLWWGYCILVWFDVVIGICYVGCSEEEVWVKYNLGSEVVLNQESDVLEIWFFLQLWLFFILGWFNEQVMVECGFDCYLLLLVLIIGFDIIFFWVVCMIMVIDNLVGKILFKDVYFIGLICDGQGQKMFKSKGNVFDLLDIIDGIIIDDLVVKCIGGLMQLKMVEKIEKVICKEFLDGIVVYGVDVLCFIIVVLVIYGCDIKFDMNCVEGYKNFCNKFWNVSCFVLMNIEGVVFIGVFKLCIDVECWIFVCLVVIIVEVQGYFVVYCFDLLVQCLYEFVWNVFCDWFLELSKLVLNGVDVVDVESICYILLYVLEVLLCLLYLLMLFIIEQLWQQLVLCLGLVEIMLLLCFYLIVVEFVGDFVQVEVDVDWLKVVISVVCCVCSELNVVLFKQVLLCLQVGLVQDCVCIECFSILLLFLLKLDSIQWLVEGESVLLVVVVIVGELKLLVLLEGLVDFDVECVCLDKEIVCVEVEKVKSEIKLVKFIDKVLLVVVEQECVCLVDWNIQLVGLCEQCVKL